MEDPLDKLSIKFGRFEASAAGKFAIVAIVIAGLLVFVFLLGGRLNGLW